MLRLTTARSLFPAEASSDAEQRLLVGPRDGPPEHLLCPISGELMSDPVLSEAFQTYDRASITEWLRRKQTDPLTNLPIGVRLRPNSTLMAAIRAWKLARVAESRSARASQPSPPPSPSTDVARRGASAAASQPSPPPSPSTDGRTASAMHREARTIVEDADAAHGAAGVEVVGQQPWPALTLKGVACKLCVKKGPRCFCHHHDRGARRGEGRVPRGSAARPSTSVRRALPREQQQPWPALTLKGVACKLCVKKGPRCFCHHHDRGARRGGGRVPRGSAAGSWPALTRKGVACKLCLKKGPGGFCHHHR